VYIHLLKSGYHSDVGRNENFCNEIYESCEVTDF